MPLKDIQLPVNKTSSMVIENQLGTQKYSGLLLNTAKKWSAVWSQGQGCWIIPATIRKCMAFFKWQIICIAKSNEDHDGCVKGLPKAEDYISFDGWNSELSNTKQKSRCKENCSSMPWRCKLYATIGQLSFWILHWISLLSVQREKKKKEEKRKEE